MNNVLATHYTIGKQAYGSNRWFAVKAGSEVDAFNAAWLKSGVDVIQTNDGPVATDGVVRFFQTKRDVLAAIERSTPTIVRGFSPNGTPTTVVSCWTPEAIVNAVARTNAADAIHIQKASR